VAARASGILLVLVSAWLFGAGLAWTQGTAPNAAEIKDLSDKLKDLSAILDKDGDKSVIPPSKITELVNSLSKVGETADNALIKSFLTLLERIQQGAPDQKKAFSEKPDVVAAKGILTALLPPQAKSADDGLKNAVLAVQDIAGRGKFAPATGLAEAQKLLSVLDKLFGEPRESFVKALAGKLTEQIPALDSKTVSDVKADTARKKPYVDLNAALQTIVGSSDLRVHIISAAYGDRFLLESFVKTGKPQSPGARSRWCNATAALRTKCERKSACTAGPLVSLCGFDPAEFTEPRYKGVIVNYACIRDSDAGYWTQPTANVSAYDAVTFSRRRAGDIVFLGSPEAQLACDVVKQ
jgi:hypothetical protein